MTARTNGLSARVQTAALWDDGDTRSDEELAAALGVTVYTIRCYRQKWNRENGKTCGRRKLSPEAVAAALDMRHHDNMTYPAIAEALGEIFGVKASAELVRISCMRDESKPVGVVDVAEEMLPLRVQGGVCWSVAIAPPNGSNAKRYKNKDGCDLCPRLEQCRAAVLGWDGRFIGCERPLEFEIMEVGSDGRAGDIQRR